MLDKKEITKEIPRGVKWILILYGIYLAFIVFGIVVASKGASSLGFAIILIIINGLVAAYLIFNEEAKDFFRVRK